jgi:hypothetical protein
MAGMVARMQHREPYPELIFVDIDAILAEQIALEFIEIDRALSKLDSFEPA